MYAYSLGDCVGGLVLMVVALTASQVKPLFLFSHHSCTFICPHFWLDGNGNALNIVHRKETFSWYKECIKVIPGFTD
jgi:hypothetical protein